MTKEEALKYLKDFKDSYWDGMPEEALDMAIQTLSQEPCDDAISRPAVLDGLKECMCEDWIKTLFATMVKQLPSVTPTCDEREKGKCPCIQKVRYNK